MRILGLSTATKIISLGLLDGDSVLFETTLAAPQAEKILFYANEVGIKPEQIEGVAVTTGPGSYSGLRGGVTAAKILADTLKVPLAAVSTLEAIAFNLIDVEGTIAIILDARLDEYNFALFGAADGKLNRLTDDTVIKYDALSNCLEKITGKIWLAGNMPHTLVWGPQFHLADEIHSHPYGINVARIGGLKIGQGEMADPLALVPNYSHQPTIREYQPK